MDYLTSSELTRTFLALGVLLLIARLLGEVARRVGQPSVVGELCAGLVLGPTVFGALAPAWQQALFPNHGPSRLVLDGVTNLGITLFLLVAGLELDLGAVVRKARTALKVSLLSILIPFLVGLGAAAAAPDLFDPDASGHRQLLAFFVGVALSITALPVVAKTLLDLKIMHTDFGMLVLASAVVNDLVGWAGFAILLGLAGADTQPFSVPMVIALTLGFAVVMLTVGRWLLGHAVTWLYAHGPWPGAVIGFTLYVALFGAAFTQWIGISSIFGAFLVGAALGGPDRLREQTKEVLTQFMSFFFAPLFFASVGLGVNFVAYFSWPVVAVVIGIACLGKLAGGYLGARWGRLSRSESLAVGVAMNSRGTMEIVLGIQALRAGLIGQHLFVGLILMAIATSSLSGPLLRRLLGRSSPGSNDSCGQGEGLTKADPKSADPQG